MPARRYILADARAITLDPAERIVDAVGIEGRRIAAVGGRAEVVARMGGDVPVVSCGGRAVVPGLIDGHAHLDREGLKHALPSLAGARSIADVQDIVAALARATPPGEWIVTMPLGQPPEFAGMPEALAEGRWPDRHDLDRAAPDNPVYIKPIWGYWRHTLPLVSVANTAALRACGIDRRTRPPIDTVEIVADTAGEPTGVFVERHFMPLVELTLMAKAPGFGVDARARALRRSMAIYNGLATTGVFEGHGIAGDVLAAYQQVRRAGAQTVRAELVYSPAWSLLGQDGAPGAVVSGWLKWLAGRGYGDDWLRLAGIYGEIDESGAGRLRAVALPQTGWAGFHYDSGLPRGATRELLLEAARSGIRAVGVWPEMLDVFAEVDRVVPLAGRRWVYGHVSVLPPARQALVGAMGLAVTTHTNRYVWKEGAALVDRLVAEHGPAAEDHLVPLRALADAGVTVSLATDNVPPSLWGPVAHAVFRRERRDGRVVAPGQRLTRMEALRAASLNGAWLCFEEDRRGSLEPGKLADLAILSDDPLTVAEEAMPAITALRTIVDGRVVHDTPGVLPAHPPEAPEDPTR